MKTRFTFARCLSLLVGMASLVSAADIRQGLIAYWQMKRTDGITTPDATPFNNHMRLVNMTAGNFVPANLATRRRSTAIQTYMTNLHLPRTNATGSADLQRGELHDRDVGEGRGTDD